MERMIVKELISLAKHFGMRGYSRLRKNYLINFKIDDLRSRPGPRCPAEFKPYQLKPKRATDELGLEPPIPEPPRDIKIKRNSNE